MKLINNTNVALRTGINNFLFVCCTLQCYDKKSFRKVVCYEIHRFVACQYLVVVANFDECRRASRVKQEWIPNNMERKETRTNSERRSAVWNIRFCQVIWALKCVQRLRARWERRWRQHTDCDSAVFTFCALARSYWCCVLHRLVQI
jgi:hypothetical protein